MTPKQMYFAVLLLALFGGLLSPLKFVLLATAPTWLPALLPGVGHYLLFPEAMVWVASAVAVVATLLIAGVPAALYERVRGSKVPDGTAMTIWMVAVFLTMIPTSGRMAF